MGLRKYIRGISLGGDGITSETSDVSLFGGGPFAENGEASISVQNPELSNDELKQLNDNNAIFTGCVIVVEEYRGVAIYEVNATDTNIVKKVGNSSFSTSSGTNNSINLYYSSSNNRFELENRFSGGANPSIFFFNG